MKSRLSDRRVSGLVAEKFNNLSPTEAGFKELALDQCKIISTRFCLCL